MSSSGPCNVGFLWSELLETFDFGRKHPIQIGRFEMLRNFIKENGFLDQSNVHIIDPQPLSEELLKKTHSENYLAKVRLISETGVGDIDIDTPGFKNIYFHSRIASGASITGIHSVMSGDVDHFISPTGGFHHAKFEKGGGFCIFNDVAASVIALKEYGLKRILIADFDVHHGNGTQLCRYPFMKTPNGCTLMMVSSRTLERVQVGDTISTCIFQWMLVILCIDMLTMNWFLH